MKRTLEFLLLSTLMLNAAAADADGSGISVMTQNQYLGADLGAIVSAPDETSFNAAVIDALQQIAANRLPERAVELARQISTRRPHLAGLQEVYQFTCEDFGSGKCATFGGAFNHHLEATLQALQDHGANYYVAAIVENLVLPPPGLPVPGLPVHLDTDGVPDLFVAVVDRDVILARHDVLTTAVDFGCARPSIDGCNFSNVANVNTLIGPVNIERGFVGVDATVRKQHFRVINTHLEVRNLSPDPLSAGIQAAQASELLGTMSLQPAPADSELLVLGDFNSAEGDLAAPFVPPYQQFINGTDLFGNQIAAPYSDVWQLNRWQSPGNTCCQDPTLTNTRSGHSQRIDIVFSQRRPRRGFSTVIGIYPWNKTPSGLWPSDHGTVISRMLY